MSRRQSLLRINEKLTERIKAHNYGTAAAWTSKRRPVRLVYHEAYDSLAAARRREKQIKGWTKRKKLNLIKALKRK